MRKLNRLSIKNFKSIREQTLVLDNLNVFIGGNGAGKSNLISVFHFLKEIVNQDLSHYVGKKGGADSILYYGRKNSPGMAFFLEFEEEKPSGEKVSNSYEITLGGTDDDNLFIADERAFYHEKDKYPNPFDLSVKLTNRESGLKNNAHICAKQIISDLDSYRIYHFHDTSDTAPVKATCDIHDNKFFRSQAENLAAFLYWLRIKKADYYLNIVDTVQQIAPFFDDFHLEPLRLNENKIRLEWKEKNSDLFFGANALSDGTLRFICLATLLLQPDLPTVILLDEPELGLHPAAITLLANLIESASTKTQVIVATQSVTLINQFEMSVIWTVEKIANQSIFNKLKPDEMRNWLDGYALGDLWEKNILGARP